MVQMYQHDLFSIVKEPEVDQIHHLILVSQERFSMDDGETESNVDTVKEEGGEREKKKSRERVEKEGKFNIV